MSVKPSYLVSHLDFVNHWIATIAEQSVTIEYLCVIVAQNNAFNFILGNDT